MYQINKALLYYMQFINKCHVWLALVELLGEIHFVPLYLLHCPLQRSLCSFIFWKSYLKASWERYRVLPPDSPLSCSFTTVSQRHGKTGTVSQGEMSPALRYFTETGLYPREATENIINPMYSPSLWDRQTLYICGYSNMPVCHPLFPPSILYFVWFSSLLTVPSPLVFLGAGRESHSLWLICYSSTATVCSCPEHCEMFSVCKSHAR